MEITPFSGVPSRQQSPAEFAETADSFLGELPRFVTEANALVAEVNGIKTATDEIKIATDAIRVTTLGYRDAAAGSATAASQSATDAAGFASDASGYANFRGQWNFLTGPISIPASTLWDDTYWMLIESVANVTAHEPGVSAVWREAKRLSTAKAYYFGGM